MAHPPAPSKEGEAGHNSGWDVVVGFFAVHYSPPKLDSVADRPKSLLLVGPSRLGKTEWARSLGRHLYFNGYFDLSQLRGDLSNVRYAVFDDFPWDRFRSFAKQWMGAQATFTVTDKYKPKMTINWGKPIIFLCNPEDEHSEMSSTWFQANLQRVYVQERLY